MPKKYVPQYDPNAKVQDEMSLLTSRFEDPGYPQAEFNRKYGRNTAHHRNDVSDEMRYQIFSVVRSYLMQEYVHHWEHEEWYKNADLYPDHGGQTMSREEYNAKAAELDVISCPLYQALCEACANAKTNKERSAFDAKLNAVSSSSHLKRQLAVLEVPGMAPQDIAQMTAKNNAYVTVEVLPDSIYARYSDQLNPQAENNQNLIADEFYRANEAKLKNGRTESELRRAFFTAKYGAGNKEAFEKDYQTAQENARRIKAIRGKQMKLLDPANLSSRASTLAHFRGEHVEGENGFEENFLNEEAQAIVSEPVNVPAEYADREPDDLYLEWFEHLPHKDPEELPGDDNARAEDETLDMAKDFYAKEYAALKAEGKESQYVGPKSRSEVSQKSEELLREAVAAYLKEQTGAEKPQLPETKEELIAKLAEKCRAERSTLQNSEEWKQYWAEHGQQELEAWREALRRELTEQYRREFRKFHEENWTTLFRPTDRSNYGDSLRKLWQEENEQKIEQKIGQIVNAKIGDLTAAGKDTYQNWLASVQEKWGKEQALKAQAAKQKEQLLKREEEHKEQLLQELSRLPELGEPSYNEEEAQTAVETTLSGTDSDRDVWDGMLGLVQKRTQLLKKSSDIFNELNDLVGPEDVKPSRYYDFKNIAAAVRTAAQAARNNVPLTAAQKQLLAEMRSQVRAELAALPKEELLSGPGYCYDTFCTYRAWQQYNEDPESAPKPEKQPDAEQQKIVEKILSCALKGSYDNYDDTDGVLDADVLEEAHQSLKQARSARPGAAKDVPAGEDAKNSPVQAIREARRELKLDEVDSSSIFSSSRKAAFGQTQTATHQYALAKNMEMCRLAERIDRNDPSDPEALFFGWLKSHVPSDQLQTVLDRLKGENGPEEYQVLHDIYLSAHGMYQDNVQKMKKVSNALFAPVVSEEDPLSQFVTGAFTDQSVVDQDLVEAHQACRDLPLNEYLTLSWNKGGTLPVEAKDIETVVAGAFLREDVLGLLAPTTFNVYENNSGTPLQARGSSDLEKMLDPFFNLTVNGDKRRVANLPRVAAPRARALAASIIAAYTNGGNPRPLAECLDNMIRVSANYTRRCTSNDHAVYAASKTVSDALDLMEKLGLKKYSALNLDELREAQAAATRYKAQAEITALRGELSEQLLQDHLAQRTPSAEVRGKMIRLAALETYCNQQAAYSRDPRFLQVDAPDPKHPEKGTTFRYLSPEELSASLDFDSYITVLQNRKTVRDHVIIGENTSAAATASFLRGNVGYVGSSSEFHPATLKENVDFLKQMRQGDVGLTIREYAIGASKLESEIDSNYQPPEQNFLEKMFSAPQVPERYKLVKDIDEVTQRVKLLGYAMQELSEMAESNPLNLYSSKGRLEKEYALYDNICKYDMEQFRKDYIRILRAKKDGVWWRFTEELNENLVTNGFTYQNDYVNACELLEGMQAHARKMLRVLGTQLSIRSESEQAAGLTLAKYQKDSPFKVTTLGQAWAKIDGTHGGNIDISDYLMRQREKSSAPVQQTQGKRVRKANLNTRQMRTLQSLNSFVEPSAPQEEQREGNQPAVKKSAKMKQTLTSKLLDANTVKSFQTRKNIDAENKRLDKDVQKPKLKKFGAGGSGGEQEKNGSPVNRLLSTTTQNLSFEGAEGDNSGPQQNRNFQRQNSNIYGGLRNQKTLRSLNTIDKNKLKTVLSRKGTTFLRNSSTISGAILGSSIGDGQKDVSGKLQQASGFGTEIRSSSFRALPSADDQFIRAAFGDDPLIPAKFLATEEELNKLGESENYARQVYQAMLVKGALQNVRQTLGIAGKTLLHDEIQSAAKAEISSMGKVSQSYQQQKNDAQVRRQKDAEKRKAEQQKQGGELTESQKKESARRVELTHHLDIYAKAEKKQQQTLDHLHLQYTQYRGKKRDLLRDQLSYEKDLQAYELDEQKYREAKAYYDQSTPLLNSIIQKNRDAVALQNQRQGELDKFRRNYKKLQEVNGKIKEIAAEMQALSGDVQPISEAELSDQKLDSTLDPQRVMDALGKLKLADNINARSKEIQDDLKELPQPGALENENNALMQRKQRLAERRAALREREAALQQEYERLERENRQALETNFADVLLAEENVRNIVRDDIRQDRRAQHRMDVIQEADENEEEEEEEKIAEGPVNAPNENEPAPQEEQNAPENPGEQPMPAVDPQAAWRTYCLQYARHGNGSGAITGWSIIAPNADTNSRRELTAQIQLLLDRAISAKTLLAEQSSQNLNPAIRPILAEGQRAYDELISCLADEKPDPNVPGRKIYTVKKDPALPDWLTDKNNRKKKLSAKDMEEQLRIEKGGFFNEEINMGEDPCASSSFLAMKACSDYLMMEAEKQRTVSMEALANGARDALQPLAEEGMEELTVEKLSSCMIDRREWRLRRQARDAESNLLRAIRDNASVEEEENPVLMVRDNPKVLREPKKDENGALVWQPPKAGHNQKQYLRDLTIARLELERYADHKDPTLQALTSNALQELERLEMAVGECREPRMVHADGRLSSALLSMYLFKRAAADYERTGLVLAGGETVTAYVMKQARALKKELSARQKDKDFRKDSLGSYLEYLPASARSTVQYENRQTVIPLLEDSIEELTKYNTVNNDTFRYLLDRTVSLYREAVNRMDRGESTDDLLYEYCKDQDGSYRVVPTEGYTMASLCRRLVGDIRLFGAEDAMKKLEAGKLLGAEYTQLTNNLAAYTIVPNRNREKSDREYLDELRSKINDSASFSSTILALSVHPGEEAEREQLITSLETRFDQTRTAFRHLSEEGYLSAADPKVKPRFSGPGEYFHRLLSAGEKYCDNLALSLGARSVKQVDTKLQLFENFNVSVNPAKREMIRRPVKGLIAFTAAQLMLRDMEERHNTDPTQTFMVDKEAYDGYLAAAEKQLLERRAKFDENLLDSGDDLFHSLKYISEYVWKDVPAEEQFLASRLRRNRVIHLETAFKEGEKAKAEKRNSAEKRRKVLEQDEANWLRQTRKEEDAKDSILTKYNNAPKKNQNEAAAGGKDSEKKLSKLDERLKKLTDENKQLTEQYAAESKLANGSETLLAKKNNQLTALETNSLQLLKDQIVLRREAFLSDRSANIGKEQEEFRRAWFGAEGEAENNRTDNLRNLGVSAEDMQANAQVRAVPAKAMEAQAMPNRNELLLECFVHINVLEQLCSMKYQELAAFTNNSEDDARFLLAVAKNARDSYLNLSSAILENGNVPGVFFEKNGLPGKDLANIALARDLFSFSSAQAADDNQLSCQVEDLIAPFAAYRNSIAGEEAAADPARNSRIQDAWNSALKFFERFARENADEPANLIGQAETIELEKADALQKAMGSSSQEVLFRRLYADVDRWTRTTAPNAVMPQLKTPEEYAAQNAAFLRDLMTDNRSLPALDRKVRVGLLQEVAAEESAAIVQNISHALLNGENDPRQAGGAANQHRQSTHVDHFLQAAQQMQPLAAAIRESVSSHAEIPGLSNYAIALKNLPLQMLTLQGYTFNEQEKKFQRTEPGKITPDIHTAICNTYDHLITQTEGLLNQKAAKDLSPRLNEILHILKADAEVLRSFRPDANHPKTLSELLQTYYEKAEQEQEENTFVFDPKQNVLTPAKNSDGLALAISYQDSKGRSRKGLLSTLGSSYTPAEAKQATFNQNAAMYWTIFPAYRKQFEALYDKDYEVYRTRCYGDTLPDVNKVSQFLASKNLRLGDEDLRRFMWGLNSIEADLVKAEEAAGQYEPYIRNNEPLKERSIIFSGLARLVGAGSCVPETKKVSMRMFGEDYPVCYSEQGKGIDLDDLKNDERHTFLGWINASRAGNQASFDPKVSPQCLQDITRLQLLDYLAGTFHRPEDKILYNIDPNTNTLMGIQLIGNTNTFPTGEFFPDLSKLKFLPQSMADQFMSLSADDLPRLLGTTAVADVPGLAGVRTRLLRLKDAITKARNNPEESPLRIVSDEDFAAKSFRDLTAEDQGMPLFTAISGACGPQALNKVVNAEIPAPAQNVPHPQANEKLERATAPSELAVTHDKLREIGIKLEKTNSFWHINSGYFENVIIALKSTLDGLRDAYNKGSQPNSEIGLEQRYADLYNACAAYVQNYQKSDANKSRVTERGRDRMLYIRQLGGAAQMRLMAIAEKKVQQQLARAIVTLAGNPNDDQVERQVAQVSGTPVFREILKGKSVADLQALIQNRTALIKEVRDTNFRMQKQANKADPNLQQPELQQQVL